MKNEWFPGVFYEMDGKLYWIISRVSSKFFQVSEVEKTNDDFYLIGDTGYITEWELERYARKKL